MAWYWAQTSGNILAIPLELVITALISIVICRPVVTAWRRIAGEHPSARAAREAAEAARRIAADLYRHHTGRDHPAAPGK